MSRMISPSKYRLSGTNHPTAYNDEIMLLKQRLDREQGILPPSDASMSKLAESSKLVFQQKLSREMRGLPGGVQSSVSSLLPPPAAPSMSASSSISNPQSFASPAAASSISSPSRSRPMADTLRRNNHSMDSSKYTLLREANVADRFAEPTMNQQYGWGHARQALSPPKFGRTKLLESVTMDKGNISVLR